MYFPPFLDGKMYGEHLRSMMATPIDLDGEVYGDPIGQTSVINRPKRTWWGKKIVEVEPEIIREFPKQKKAEDMTYTKHGHHIDGTVMTNKPKEMARCGGPGVCGPCSIEAASYKPYPDGTRLHWDQNAHDVFHTREFVTGCGFCFDDQRKAPVVGVARIEPVVSESLYKLGSSENFQTKAIRIVKKHVDDGFVGFSEKPAYEIFVVWYSKTLQNWKAMVSTTLPDHMYYEVTYNGDKQETYLNAYVQTVNIVVPD